MFVAEKVLLLLVIYLTAYELHIWYSISFSWYKGVQCKKKQLGA